MLLCAVVDCGMVVESFASCVVVVSLLVELLSLLLCAVVDCGMVVESFASCVVVVSLLVELLSLFLSLVCCLVRLLCYGRCLFR